MTDTHLEKIQRLKQKRNAVILAHNYQPGEIQDLADFTGDSLGLSIEASQTDADVIVFCGVLFMAETAAILSPDKTVLLPEPTAGCPMADMITAEQLREQKAKYPDALVVCYVNSTAEVKAESDYCCTSSNAVELVRSLPEHKKILFVPDRNLGSHVKQQTGRDIVLWPGYCASHTLITEDDIKRSRAEHFDAVVLAHPECTDPVKDLADKLLSTGQMLKFVKQSSADAFIIATEKGIIHALQKVRPDAQFIPATERAICPNMKKITMAKIIEALEKMQHHITVPEDIAQKARKSLDRMIEVVPST